MVEGPMFLSLVGKSSVEGRQALGLFWRKLKFERRTIGISVSTTVASGFSSTSPAVSAGGGGGGGGGGVVGGGGGGEGAAVVGVAGSAALEEAATSWSSA